MKITSTKTQSLLETLWIKANIWAYKANYRYDLNNISIAGYVWKAAGKTLHGHPKKLHLLTQLAVESTSEYQELDYNEIYLELQELGAKYCAYEYEGWEYELDLTPPFLKGRESWILWSNSVGKRGTYITTTGKKVETKIVKLQGGELIIGRDGQIKTYKRAA